jgi:hypothetical protein
MCHESGRDHYLATDKHFSLFDGCTYFIGDPHSTPVGHLFSIMWKTGAKNGCTYFIGHYYIVYNSIQFAPVHVVEGSVHLTLSFMMSVIMVQTLC